MEEARSQPEREEKVLEYWNTHGTFKKTEKGIPLQKGFARIRERLFGKKKFVFYDGPPFANGLPHYGHLVASAIKDAVPRYKTMRGFSVARRWGWDCHGLPVEVEVEKKLGLGSKQEIEKFGIEKFNQEARDSILKYSKDWEKTIKRFGRFIDMRNDYRTLDVSFMESVWHVFAKIAKRGFLYEGHKVVHYCTRCGTSLSNNEVAEGYEDLDDLAVTVLLPIKGTSEYLAIWTTTAWTLPGNTAAAVNKNHTYCKAFVDGKVIIVGKLYAEHQNLDVIEEFSGEKLIGLRYTPPFDYFYSDEQAQGFRIYHADYVNEDSGTGVVHLAPAYGAEDYTLAKQQNIPIIHHVSKQGVFTDSVRDLKGLLAKPKENPRETDEKIALLLEEKGVLFHKEIHNHKYPLCWRCDTPLLNYATDSWFIKVPEYRDTMVSENKKTNWVPSHLRDKRFGNWIANSPEWAFSRDRYWGTPVPIWKNKDTGKTIIVDSIETMKKYLPKAKNKYIFIRHGESEKNTKGILNSDGRTPNPLTKKGIQQAKGAGKALKGVHIDMVISSPLPRTKETAQYICKEIGIDPETIIIDREFSETRMGDWEGKTIDFVNKECEEPQDLFKESAPGKEPIGEVYRRSVKRLYRLEQKYEGKTIVVVAHNGVVRAVQFADRGIEVPRNHPALRRYDKFIKQKNGCVVHLDFKPLPHNHRYETDLHRPYIDSVVLYDEEGAEYTHIGKVFDCWFESGSMPYGSVGYPVMSAKNEFNPIKNKGFPADFIAEGQDQTRGWFYSLLAVSVGAYDKAPFKNVIVSGIVLAKDGKKVSKKLRNYTDPVVLMNQCGADPVRQYLLSSPVMRAESLAFSDQEVEEIGKKIISRFCNCLSFFNTYKHLPIAKEVKPKSLIDVWIHARIASARDEITNGYDCYELDKATRPMGDLIEDFSAWYLRSSRTALKEDSDSGKRSRAVFRHALKTIAQLMAPSMPFTSEYVFGQLGCKEESVHLSIWPEKIPYSKDVLKRMEAVRAAISLGHEARSSSGIRARQPLAKITVPLGSEYSKDEKDLIKSELNVYDVVESVAVAEGKVNLDTVLSMELREEGFVRECIRNIQQLRKEEKYLPTQIIQTLHICVDESTEALLLRHVENIQNTAQISEISFEEGQQTHTRTIEGVQISFTLRK